MWTGQEINKAIKKSKADWDQNDSSADNYIKNRTHWEEEKITTLVNNLTSEEYDNGDYPACAFVVGDKYDVIWNGQLYSQLECVQDGEWRVLGNSDQLPFYIDDDGGNSLYISSNDDSTDWTVSIIGQKTVIHKLDSKYLPKEVATVAEVQAVQATADMAVANAATAQTSANTAQTAANKAQTTANTAQTAANNASKAAAGKMSLVESTIWLPKKSNAVVWWNNPVYGNGKFVITSSNGDRAAYSEDGINWTETKLPVGQEWGAPVHVNGKFFSVPRFTTTTQDIIAAYSDDGVIWNAIEFGTAQEMRNPVYINGKFIIGTTMFVAYSEDCVTWTKASIPASCNGSTIAYGGGRFVVMPQDTNNTVAYSDDLITWNTVSIPSMKNSNAYTPVYFNDKFVTVGNSTIAGAVFYSEDGVTWNDIPLSTRGLYQIFCVNEKLFMRYSSSALTSATHALLYSEDGINWIETNLPASFSALAVTHGNGKFVTTTNTTSNIAFYSEDGINWNETLLPRRSIFKAPVYTNGQFFTVGTYSQNCVLYSEDGINWAETTLPASNKWSYPVFGNDKLAIIITTNSDYVLYSKDGITWKNTISTVMQNETNVTDTLKDVLGVSEDIAQPDLSQNNPNATDFVKGKEEVVFRPDTAVIGQTIVVKSVDENNKPIEWEAVDISSGVQPDWNQNDPNAPDYVKNRTHWSEFVEIHPTVEVTPEYDPTFNAAITYFEQYVPIKLGNIYKIIFDGVEYICEPFMASIQGLSFPAIGNTIIAGAEDSGEPFAIASLNLGTDVLSGVVCMDMNPHTVSILENGAHKISPKFIPSPEELWIHTTEILPETEMLPSDEPGLFYLPQGIFFTPGTEYIVTYNGIDYKTTAAIFEGMDIAYIGNFTLSTDEPFAILPYETDDGLITAMFVHGTITSVIVSIKETVSEKIPELCLPDTVITEKEFDQVIDDIESQLDNTTSVANQAMSEARKKLNINNPSGWGSFSCGYTPVASGECSQAMGCLTRAQGDYSHAEGRTWSHGIKITGEANSLTYTVTSINPNPPIRAYFPITYIDKESVEHFAIIMAVDNVANTITLDRTLSSTALQDASVSWGQGTAYGYCSHVEGNNTVAVEHSAHAEGSWTSAMGASSHVEGLHTLAIGAQSHAEGFSTSAKGDYSHAEGQYTISNGRSQHVQGEYNIPDTQGSKTTRGKYAHIVGNGTSASASNAHTLDWDGNAWYAGSVECTSVIIKSSTEGSTKKFKLTIDDSGTISAVEV